MEWDSFDEWVVDLMRGDDSFNRRNPIEMDERLDSEDGTKDTQETP